MANDHYAELFEKLTDNLNCFLKTVMSKKTSLKATDLWTVKDVLCHIVFWHETYAKNYHALAYHLSPVVPAKSMNILNLEGVAALRKLPLSTLLTRLNTAHESLRESIVIHKVPQMTYKQGGRTYTTPDFLDIVTRHLATHTIHVRRAPTKSVSLKAARKKLPKTH